MIEYSPHLIVKYLVYVVAVWFFIILILSDKNDRISAAIIFIFCVINILWSSEIKAVKFSTEYFQEYFARKEFLIMLDGACALILTQFMTLDKSTIKQAFLLSMAILCNTAMVFDYKVSQTLITGLIYNWYDELIITIALLKMVSSYDGFINALSNLQSLLSRRNFYFHGSVKNISSQKKAKAKT